MPPRKVIRGELVAPRYRLAVIEEPSGRVALRIAIIPDGVIKFVAEKLKAAIPLLVQAAQYRDVADKIADLLHGPGARRGRG